MQNVFGPDTDPNIFTITLLGRDRAVQIDGLQLVSVVKASAGDIDDPADADISEAVRRCGRLEGGASMDTIADWREEELWSIGARVLNALGDLGNAQGAPQTSPPPTG